MIYVINGVFIFAIINGILIAFKTLSSNPVTEPGVIVNVILRIMYFFLIMFLYVLLNMLFIFVQNLEILYYLLIVTMSIWNILKFKNLLRHIESSWFTNLYSYEKQFLNGGIAFVVSIISIGLLLFIFYDLFLSAFI